MPFIYKIENQINHKKYIGKTLYTIERRWKQHQYNASKREDLRHMPLYAAMRKYGIENFNITPIEEIDDKTILSEREQYWIQYYNTYNIGYNATLGGDGGILYDYDEIWNLWQKGLNIKQISDRINCNDYVVRTVLNLHNVSTEERLKRSEKQQIKSHIPFQRKVEQIDIYTGQIIKIFPSVSAAASSVGYDESYFSKICSNESILNGYKWKYSKNNNYIKKDYSPRPVNQIDLNTKQIIHTYQSLSEAARAVNGDSSYIGKVCRGLQKSSKGFGWEYLKEN